jgi:hypothetical protein
LIFNDVSVNENDVSFESLEKAHNLDRFFQKSRHDRATKSGRSFDRYETFGIVKKLYRFNGFVVNSLKFTGIERGTF